MGATEEIMEMAKVNNFPYYEDQTGWTANEYYCLHRYLHRMFYYNSKRIDEIKNINIAQLTKETKVIIYCIIPNTIL